MQVHYVSHERKFRGHLKKSRAKSPFFMGHGKPCMCMDLFLSSNLKKGQDFCPRGHGYKTIESFTCSTQPSAHEIYSAHNR